MGPIPRIPPRPTSLRLRVAFVLLAIVGCLALVEALLHGLDTFPPPRAPVSVHPKDSGELLLVLRHGTEDIDIITATPAADPGRLRLVMVGDSTIWGTHLREHSTIPTQLEVLLEAATLRPWEVLNLGRSGLPARDVCAVGEAALAHLAPDLLVVYTGHNEFLQPHVRDVLAELEHPLRARLARTFGWSSIGRGLTRMPAAQSVRRSPAPADVEHRQILERSKLAPIRPRVQRDFHERLVRTARASAAAGVPLILVGPASNGREYSPLRSTFSRPLSAEEQERFAGHLSRVVEALRSGDLVAWEESFAAAAAIDDSVAELLHQRATLLWSRGQGPAARVVDLEKWGLDDHARAASLALIQGMESAAARTGTPFVYVGPLLEREPRAQERILFLDHVHPSILGQYLIASALVEPAAAAVGARLVAPIPSPEEVYAALGITPEILERTELLAVRGVVSYACWAFDPEPHIAQARLLLDRIDGRLAREPDLLVARLYLALLEGDGARALQISGALRDAGGAYHGPALRMVQTLPRLRDAALRSGLTLDPGPPPALRRAP